MLCDCDTRGIIKLSLALIIGIMTCLISKHHSDTSVPYQGILLLAPAYYLGNFLRTCAPLGQYKSFRV